MTAQLIFLRNQVLAAITAYQTSPGFSYNGFVAAASYIPAQKIEAADSQAGKVWVIGSILGDEERKTRMQPPLTQRELHVQVGYQQTNVTPDNITLLDQLCGVAEQLRDAVKNYAYTAIDAAGCAPLWTRHECLRDPNGLPLHYYMLREAVTFESYFTACFTVPHQ